MSKGKTQKMGTFASLLVVLMAFGTFATATALVTKNQFSLAPTSLADDGEDDNEDSKDDSEDDEDDNEDSSKAEKEKEKKSEEAKKRSERAREDAKKQFERSHKDANDDASDEEDDNEEGEDVDDESDSEDDDANDDNDSEDDANEVEGDDDGDDHGMFKDRTKTISKLSKDIAEAEKEILEKQAEGVDVTAALARLALAKAAISSVNGAFDASNLEEVKRLAKETKKLTHFAREDDLHDAKKVAEDAAKVAKRIAQIKKKLVELKALGGETSSFEAMLAEVEKSLAASEALIANGGADALSGFAGLEAAERRAKTIKSAIENAIFALGGEEDDDFGDDHRSEVADFVKSLNDVADIEEGGIGKQVRIVARAQKLSSDKVASLVDDAKSRGDLAKLLIGPKTDALDGIQDEIVANNVRIEILNRALAQVTDEDIKAILSEQIATLQQETTQLQSFVGSQSNTSSLLGWLSALLPKF